MTVRLTGSIPIADDEFATLKEGAELNGAMTVFAVLIILWLALHSVRIILAVFVSLFVGLFVTAAAVSPWPDVQPDLNRFLRAFCRYRRRFRAATQRDYRAERLEREDLFGSLVATAANDGRAPGAGRRGNGRRLPGLYAHRL